MNLNNSISYSKKEELNNHLSLPIFPNFQKNDNNNNNENFHKKIKRISKKTFLKESLEYIKVSDPRLVSLDLGSSKNHNSIKAIKPLADALLINTTLESLNLSGNDIGKKGARDLSLALQKNSKINLIELDLSNNNLTNEGAKDVIHSLIRNSSIQALSLSNNNLNDSISMDLSTLLLENSSIKHLKLTDNPKIGNQGIIELTNAIKNSKNLNSFELAHIGLNKNSANYLSDIIKWNNSLTFIDISNNFIKDEGILIIAESLKINKTITQLHLSNINIKIKGLTALCEAIFHQHSNIRILDISKNKIGKKGGYVIGDGLKRTKSLIKLNISKCLIESDGASYIFEGILENKSLSYLDISKNKIGKRSGSNILSAIRHNKILKTLILSNNSLDKGLKGIGAELKFNQTLKSLYLDKNPISTQIAHDIAEGLTSNTSLTTLNLKGTNMGSEGNFLLEKTYEQSIYLYHLWLSNSYCSTKNLSNQNLNQFPHSLLSMYHLKTLILSDNNLTELPSKISELTCLRELNIKNNKLKSLPFSLSELSSTLKVLIVDGNPLITPPKEIVKKGRKEILGYLKDLTHGSEPCYRVKLMVVGQENVGKTTLIKHFYQKKKSKTLRSKNINLEENISTDGIDIGNWIVNIPFKEQDGKIKKQNVTISIWDFAGQELYYTSHQFFLSERSVYIVVFDLRFPEEQSRLEFWLQSIEARAGNSPIIIVGSHADDKICTNEYIDYVLEKITNKYCSKYPNIKSIVVTDITKNVKQIKESLKKIISELPTMGEPLPLTYLELEKIILDYCKFSSPIVTWKNFIKIGNIANIFDPSTLLRATKFFHDLGILVYFDDSSCGLNDLVILDPQFITNLLSSIITTKHKFVKNGILFHNDLMQIWRPPSFPIELHSSFLVLLEKFEILYDLNKKKKKITDTIDYQQGKSLIPCLLPNESPNIDENKCEYWKLNDNLRNYQLNRYYEFQFIPYGFFSRLMVRMLNLCSDIAIYWKNGAILYNNINAIKNEKENNKIENYDEVILIRIFPENKLLQISIRGFQLPVSTFRIIVETINNLITNWFHIEVIEKIPCSQCLKKQISLPFIFVLSDCIQNILNGNNKVICGNQHEILFDNIIPDLMMVDVNLERVHNFQTDIKLEKELGKGAFGIIYKGIWKSNVEVAVKKLIINDISVDSTTVYNEFRREVYLMSKLKHPNIVNLMAFSVNPFAMGDLYSFLHNEKKNISMELKIRIAFDIAQGMKFLHSFQPPFIHRDLKSPNILLASTSENDIVVAKISDFGTSTQLLIGALKEISTFRAVTLPNWLAPEVINQEEYTEKSDCYAFGIILWELLTRLHPFQEYTWMAELEDAIIEGKRPEIPYTCPESLKILIEKCWHSNPEQRPSFNQIVEILYQIILSITPSLNSIYKK